MNSENKQSSIVRIKVNSFLSERKQVSIKASGIVADKTDEDWNFFILPLMQSGDIKNTFHHKQQLYQKN